MSYIACISTFEIMFFSVLFHLNLSWMLIILTLGIFVLQMFRCVWQITSARAISFLARRSVPVMAGRSLITPAGARRALAVCAAVGTTLTASAFADSKSSSDAATVVPNNPEKWTGSVFPRTLTVPGASASSADEPAELVGVGVRCVKGLCILPQARAYAAGLYVRPKQMASVVAGASAYSSLVPQSNDTAFESIFLSVPKQNTGTAVPNVYRAVRLVFTNDVRSEHVSGGWGTSLRKRVALNPRLTESAIGSFTAIFGTGNGQIKKGSELIITTDGSSDPDTGLVVYWNGARVLDSSKLGGGENGQQLGWALLHMYFSDDPISWDIKDQFKAGWERQYKQQQHKK